MKFCLFKNKNSQLFCFTMSNSQTEWNAICFTHNFIDFLLNVTLNGKQMNSKKIQLSRAFLDELTKPLSIGLNTSFWGQISDFNIWNRPLSYEEVQQYSFGCHEGFSTQPEILDSSKTSISSSGINFQPYKIKRQLLTCGKGIVHYTFFENTNDIDYYRSIEFCNLLKGDMFDPVFLENGQEQKYKNWHWVPLKMSGEKGQLGKQASNLTLTATEKPSQCRYADKTSKDYISRNCNDKLPSFCKVYN